MSGVYILETKGPEYRVAYSKHIESIYGLFNDKTISPDPKWSYIYLIFNNKKHIILKNAFKEAIKISKEYNHLADGIQLIETFKSLDWNEHIPNELKGEFIAMHP